MVVVVVALVLVLLLAVVVVVVMILAPVLLLLVVLLGGVCTPVPCLLSSLGCIYDWRSTGGVLPLAFRYATITPQQLLMPPPPHPFPLSVPSPLPPAHTASNARVCFVLFSLCVLFVCSFVLLGLFFFVTVFFLVFVPSYTRQRGLRQPRRPPRHTDHRPSPRVAGDAR